MPHRIYLASRYSRREELCGYREQLQSAGLVVTSRWLNGAHQIADNGLPLGPQGEALVEGTEGDDGSTNVECVALREQFAEEDFDDILSAQTLVAFTEPPRSNASRGGRHVELGIAIGRFKRVCVVGHRENIFCWMDGVKFFATWDECLTYLKTIPAIA